MDNPILIYSCLILAGAFAGFINTIAGGGSMLTLPLLMIFNLPAGIANGTNRVSIFVGAVVSMFQWKKHGQLQIDHWFWFLFPSLLGGLAGAGITKYIPDHILKNTLIICMVSMALIMILIPNSMPVDDSEKPLSYSKKPITWVYMFFAGFYGGFIQAGVGFILLMALSGGLRYDLVKANALKVVCTFAFTCVALTVFIFNNQIVWSYGIALAIGTSIGSIISVNFALKIKKKTLKWIVFIMVVIASIAAILKK